MGAIKLAITFDSAFTNIYMLGGGLVLSEPTVAAVVQDEKAEIPGHERQDRAYRTHSGRRLHACRVG